MTSDNSELLDQLRINRETPIEPDRRGVTRLWASAALLVLLGLAAWWVLRAPAAIAVTTLTISAPRLRPADSVLDASGYVTARRRATVSSKITGKVKQVLVEEGMSVKAGQVVAFLDDTSERMRLKLGEAQLQAARSKIADFTVQFDESQLVLERTRQLTARKLASQSELDSAQAATDSLKSRVQAARSDVVVSERNLDVLKDQLDQTIIRAPFAGVVVAKNAQPGEMISPTSAGGGFTRTGICTVVDMDSLEVDVDVNEAYIHRVTPGQRVTAVLDAYPDWNIEAQVLAIVPTADRQRATVKVRIGFARRDPRILPDMGVKVSFLGNDKPLAEPGERSELAVVPLAALRGSGDERFVWLVQDGRVQRKAVLIESVEGAQARIASGVGPGQTVVLESPSELHDGVRVQVHKASEAGEP